MRSYILVLIFSLLFINAANAAVSIDNVSISPNPIYQGQTTTVTVTVTASGTSASNVSVTIGYPAGVSIVGSATQVIASIPAGGSQSVSWTVKGEQASSTPYTLTFTATGASSASNAQLSVLTPPFIEVSNQSCSSTSINVQQTVTISFILKNTGGDATNAQVSVADYNSDCLQLVAGQASWSQDINAGGQVALSYDFNAIDACTETLLFQISSAYNDPNDYSCTITTNAVCGDGYCSNGETCSNCSSDCGSCPTTPTPTPTPTTTPTPSPSSSSTSGPSTGTSPTPTQTPTGTPSETPSPEETPKGAKKIEKLFEKTITKKPTATEIKELLEKVGASEKAIEAATKALSKTTVMRKLTVEKITDEKGNISFKTTITLKVSNKTGKKLLNVRVVEVIPKNVLEHVDENIIESDFAFEIIEADPVLRFTVPELDVNQSIELNYAIKEGVNTEAAEEWKAAFIAEFEEAPIDLCKDVVCEPQLCKEASCDPATGECIYENLPDGAICGENKECKAGECVEIVEKGKPIDLTLIFIALVLLGILIVVAFFIKKEIEKRKTPLEKAVHDAHKEAIKEKVKKLKI